MDTLLNEHPKPQSSNKQMLSQVSPMSRIFY